MCIDSVTVAMVICSCSNTATQMFVLSLFQELSGDGFSRVLVLMKSLVLLSENKDDLQELIKLGLTFKVINNLSELLTICRTDQKSVKVINTVIWFNLLICCLGDIMVWSCSWPVDLWPSYRLHPPLQLDWRVLWLLPGEEHAGNWSSNHWCSCRWFRSVLPNCDPRGTE